MEKKVHKNLRQFVLKKQLKLKYSYIVLAILFLTIYQKYTQMFIKKY